MYDSTSLYFVAQIKLDGADFDDRQGEALADILRRIADTLGDELLESRSYAAARDANGNVVGRFGIKLGWVLNR